MIRFTDDTLLGLLRAPEAANVERKSTWSRETSTRAREAVCAFANDLPGTGRPGVLFVGAHDDGTPADLAITDELLLGLSDVRTDGNIIPIPSISVERRVLGGGEIAVVTVAPSDYPPVALQGPHLGTYRAM